MYTPEKTCSNTIHICDTMAKTGNKPIVTITNILASSMISGFDVKTILEKIPGAKYRPNGFPATVISMGHMKINLYDSGKITSTRSTREEKAIKSIYDFVKKLNNLGMDSKVESEPQISMIAAIVDYSGTIDLDALRDTIYYTKDLQSFPAIQMSFPNGVAVKAYDSKLVITAKTLGFMIPVIKEIKKYMWNISEAERNAYRKQCDKGDKKIHEE